MERPKKPVTTIAADTNVDELMASMKRLPQYMADMERYADHLEAKVKAFEDRDAFFEWEADKLFAEFGDHDEAQPVGEVVDG